MSFVSLRRREFELWAKIASKEVMAVPDLAAWGQWIVDNAKQLHDCEVHNPAARGIIQQAINESQKRFP